jgi:hypothetical protein
MGRVNLTHKEHPMKISNDPIIQRGGITPSKNAAVFAQLTPENNCLILEDKKHVDNISQQLEYWVKRHKPGCKVRTTSAYPVDGKPRVWLVFPEPVKTTIRGNFPS